MSLKFKCFCQVSTTLPKLPQSYKVKYFSSKKPVMGEPLLISNPNVTSSSHGLQGSSLPLFSPCNSNPSNGDHDDDVMSLDESDPTLEIDLLVVPSKLTVQKKVMFLGNFKIFGL